MAVSTELLFRRKHKLNTQRALREAARDLSYDPSDPARRERFAEAVSGLPVSDTTIQRVVTGQLNRRIRESKNIAQ